MLFFELQNNEKLFFFVFGSICFHEKFVALSTNFVALCFYFAKEHAIDDGKALIEHI